MDGAESGMKGICLRGLPGWGEVFAPLTTVVNTYGGTWFDKDWNAQVNAQPFKDATTFYTDLVKAHGESGAAQAGFAECLTATTQSKVAMWYDATSAAGSLEAPDSPVKGKMAYVQAPVKETKSSGWLYAWSWAIEKKSQKADNAWKFISWASSQKYEELVGAQDGWATVPAGKRESTYKNADYIKAAEAFAEPTRKAIESADPTNPGVQPRPTVGIQFVDIPEFTDFATKISPGRLGGDRRQEDRRRGARQRPEARAGRGRQVQGQVAPLEVGSCRRWSCQRRATRPRPTPGPGRRAGTARTTHPEPTREEQRMATATAAPPSQAAPAQKKSKPPQRELRRALGRQEGLGAPGAAAPGAGLHRDHDPAAVPGHDPRSSFTNWNANYPDEIKFGTLQNFVDRLHRPGLR